MDNIYVASGTTALLVSVGMQVLKNTAWFPWLSRNSGKINAWVSLLAAFATSVGIVASFDYNAASGDFVGQFHGNLKDVLHVLEHTLTQWATQHGVYKAFIVPAETLGEIRALLARELPPTVSEGAEKAREAQLQVAPAQPGHDANPFPPSPKGL